MTGTFVDTSAFFAAANVSDVNHERAKSILSDQSVPVTTDHVLIETWQLLNGRISRLVAETFLTELMRGIVTVELIKTADLEAARTIGETFPDQNFSLIDRTSFAVIERLGLSRVAAFDDHFVVYRYGPRRDRAFEVLR